MKIFDYKKHRIPKKYLSIASSYRRSINKNLRHEYDFSLNSLKEQYIFESRGTGQPDKKINGYSYGKWIYDITITEIKKDVEDGLFDKKELLEGACYRMRQTIKEWKSSYVDLYYEGIKHIQNSLTHLKNPDETIKQIVKNISYKKEYPFEVSN